MNINPNWLRGGALIHRNQQLLKERYGTNIGRAHNCDGWMPDGELRWLAQQARKSKVVIELGSWHGKSSRAIADNLPEDGRLYCIDTWAGSRVEQDTNHASARMMDGDHAYDEFCRNVWEHMESGKLVPLRMHGQHAARLLYDNGVRSDFIFIDGGHAKGETLTDISIFLPLLKKGGIMSGHDYINGMWPDVTTEVKEVFGQYIGNPENTTIWYTDSPALNKSEEKGGFKQYYRKAFTFKDGKYISTDDENLYELDQIHTKPKIYDCFIFNNEYEILERRLSQLYDVVDRFVIVEATKTHSGKKKELNFERGPDSYREWMNKITYIVVDDLPEIEGTITDKSWARERFQRDAIMRGLTDCRDNDIIIISDCDEIPSPSAIHSYNGSNDIRSFEMDLFYYNHDTKAKDKWREAKILPYGLLKQHSPCWARYEKAEPITNGGNHYSYFGGVQNIIQKLSDTAHVEYDNDHYKDPERIAKAIENKSDLFDRDYVKFQ